MRRMKHVIQGLGVLFLAAYLEASVGKIVALKGEVEVLRGGTAMPGAIGLELEEKDRVNVQGDGKAQLLFNDETVVTIGKESTFIVEGYRFGGADDTVDFSVPKGVFRTITGQIAKAAPEKFKLTSRTATIGVRGTHFLGRIDPEWDTIACTVGEIAVSPLGMAGEVRVPAGQITFVAPQTLPTPPRDFKPGEIKALTKAVGNGETAQTSAGQEDVSTSVGDKEDKTAQKLNTAEVLELMESDRLEGKQVVLVSGPDGSYFQVLDAGEDMRSVEQIIAYELNQQLQDAIAASQERVQGYSGQSIFSVIEGTKAALEVPATWDSAEIKGTKGYVGTGEDGDYSARAEKVNDEMRETHIHYLDLEGFTSTTTALNFTNTAVPTNPLDATGGYSGFYTEETPISPAIAVLFDDQFGINVNDYLMYDNLGEFFVHAQVGTDTLDPAWSYLDAKYYGLKSSYTALPTSGVVSYRRVFDAFNFYDTSSVDSIGHRYNYTPERDTTTYQSRETTINFGNRNLLGISSYREDGDKIRVVIGRVSDDGSGNAVVNGTLYQYQVDGMSALDTDYILAGDLEGNLYGTDQQGIGMTYDGTLAGTTDFYGIEAGYKEETDSYLGDTTTITTPATLATQKGYAIGMNLSGEVVKADATVDITPTSGEDVSATFSDSINGVDYLFNGTNAAETASFVSKDAFGVVLSDIGGISGETIHQGLMVTTPVENYDGTHNEYTSWGYWGADYTDTTREAMLAKSVWITGEPTVVSEIPTVNTFTYSGSVIGSVQTFSGSTLTGSEAIAMNANNAVSLTVDFGAPSSSFIQSGSYIKFDTLSGQHWNTTISGGTRTDGNFVTTTVSGDVGGVTSAITSGEVKGTVYGADAAAVGGSFDFATTNQVATGVFQAKQQQ